MRHLEKAKEHYEHKASVSQAVEGYRKLFDDSGSDNAISDQTKLVKDTIEEVLNNPAKSAGHQTSEFDEEFLDKVGKLLEFVNKNTGRSNS